jgi:hypothetical protein
MPTYPKWVNAIAYRIIVAGIAVLCVAILTEGCRKTTTGTQNPPAIQAKQPIQQPPPQWHQEEINRWLQAEQQRQQELLMRQSQAQQQIWAMQEQQMRAAQEQQRLEMRAAQEQQWLEWSRNYYISQIYPRIKNSLAYVLAQQKLLSIAIDEQNYLLLQQIASQDISFLINFGVPANFYPPKARDLLLSAEGDLKGIVINTQDFAAKIFNGTIFLNPSEANTWLARGERYLSNALQKIMAAQEMLGLSLEPPQ